MSAGVIKKQPSPGPLNFYSVLLKISLCCTDSLPICAKSPTWKQIILCLWIFTTGYTWGVKTRLCSNTCTTIWVDGEWYNNIRVPWRLWSLQCIALHFTSPLWRDSGKTPQMANPGPALKSKVTGAAQQRMRASDETRLTRLWWNNNPLSFNLICFVSFPLRLFVCSHDFGCCLSSGGMYTCSSQTLVHLLSSQVLFGGSAMLSFSSAFPPPPIYTQGFSNFPCWSLSF